MVLEKEEEKEGKKRERLIYREIERSEIERQRGRETERGCNRETDKEIDRWRMKQQRSLILRNSRKDKSCCELVNRDRFMNGLENS